MLQHRQLIEFVIRVVEQLLDKLGVDGRMGPRDWLANDRLILIADHAGNEESRGAHRFRQPGETGAVAYEIRTHGDENTNVAPGTAARFEQQCNKEFRLITRTCLVQAILNLAYSPFGISEQLLELVHHQHELVRFRQLGLAKRFDKTETGSIQLECDPLPSDFCSRFVAIPGKTGQRFRERFDRRVARPHDPPCPLCGTSLSVLLVKNVKQPGTGQ